MNETFQVLKLGAADTTEDVFPFDRQAIKDFHQQALFSRETGRRIRHVLGPNSTIRFTWDESTSTRDTFAFHTPLPSHVRLYGALALTYGAKAIRYYSAQPGPNVDTASDGGPVGIFEQMFADFGLVVPTSNVTDWSVYKPKWPPPPDSVGVIPGYFTGFKSTFDEMLSLNRWIRRIGTKLVDLRWREGYSVHWGRKRLGNPKDVGRTPRPLPNDEIVASVTTRHPITGTVDLPWKTYVELGFFHTKFGTDQGGNVDPMLDTNYVFVTNRRIFETGNYDQGELGYSGDIKKVMDTLSETRIVSVEFNLGHPDTTQYAFIRVREVLPDTATPLPLLGIRKGLDTIVHGGNAVELTLGAGRSALLEITYEPSDESLEAGQLDRNNQRKILYEPHGDRYYMTWEKYDTASSTDHIYLRRSQPMADRGSIIWEPVAINLSESKGLFDVTRTINRHPSMTYRRINDSLLIVSVVWTAHPWDSNQSGRREVLLREVEYFDYYDSVESTPVATYNWTPQKITVDDHDGLDPDQWGTPVISTANFGEYIAWSDSSVGIVARGILLDSTVFNSFTWAARDTVNDVLTSIGLPPGQYPAMPPFGHRGIADSSVAIVWQQGDDPNKSPYTGLFYARLIYIPPTAGPAVGLSLPTFTTLQTFLSPNAGLFTYDTRQYLHPTIDQSQDAFGRVMEAVGFERHYVSQTVPTTKWTHELSVQNVIYDTATSDAALAGNVLTYAVNDVEMNLGYGYPVISSENQILDAADSNETPLFAVVSREQLGSASDRGFRVLESTWVTAGDPDWVKTTYAPFKVDERIYSYLGVEPNGAASTGYLDDRYTAAYVRPSDSTIRTSREYFAKGSAPNDYVAEGRDVAAVLDDSLGIAVRSRLFDVWYHDTAARPVGPTAWTEADSIGGLFDQLRTIPFVACDSVTFGGYAEFELFAGSGSGDPTVDCLVELVDSSTGNVVVLLDSVRLDTASRSHRFRIDTTLDLLSATMYVRLRLESTSIDRSHQLDSTDIRSVARIVSTVPPISAKRGGRRIETGPVARISAQPNPADDRVEMRFSIGRPAEVTVVLIDGVGREIARPISAIEYSAGRYSVEFGTDNLPSGSYIVELRAGKERATTRLVVR